MNGDRPQIGDLRPVFDVGGRGGFQLFGYTVRFG